MGQQETPSLSKSCTIVVVQHSCLALSIYYYIEVGFSVPLTSEHISQSDFLSVRQKVILLISLHSLFFVGLYCIGIIVSHGTDSVRAHEYSHRTATEWESRQFLQVLPTFSLSLNRPKCPRVFEAYTAEE